MANCFTLGKAHGCEIYENFGLAINFCLMQVPYALKSLVPRGLYLVCIRIIARLRSL
jgi:hypothetical protein